MKVATRALPICLLLLVVASTLDAAQTLEYVDHEMAGDPDVYRIFTLVEPSDVELYRDGRRADEQDDIARLRRKPVMRADEPGLSSMRDPDGKHAEGAGPQLRGGRVW